MPIGPLKCARIVLTVVSFTLVAVQLWRSISLASSFSRNIRVTTTIPDVSPFAPEDRPVVVVDDASLGQSPTEQRYAIGAKTTPTNAHDVTSSLHVTSTREEEVTARSRSENPILDILSIGSNQRPEYLAAQRETIGSHASVRYFVSATEDDDTSDPLCSSQLKREDAQAISEFCRLDASHEIIAGAPGSLLKRMREQYVEWEEMLAPRTNPQGWVCAQKRPSDALNRLIHQYRAGTALPDYLLIADDDTYLNLPRVMASLKHLYSSETPLFLAGCLIDMRLPEHITNPFGGWGTFLSRGALQRLLIPIHCDEDVTSTTPTQNSTFSTSFEQNACERLHQNLLDEQRYWRNGMSVADLAHSYVATTKFEDYKTWSEETGSYCLHSDWIWGYFFNYYHVGSHTGDPLHAHVPHARMSSYKRSEFGTSNPRDMKRVLAMKGQCQFGRVHCNEQSEICHYTNPQQMFNLTDLHRRSYPDQFLQQPLTRLKGNWSAVWSQTSERRGGIQSKQPDFSINAVNSVVPVFVYPSSSAHEDELNSFVWDGIQRSSKLSWTRNATEANIWIVDVRRARLTNNRFCNRFVNLIESTKQNRIYDAPPLKVAFLYFDDLILDDFSYCYRATRRLDSTRVYRYRSSMVKGRQWNETSHFVDEGEVVNYGNWRLHSAAPVRHVGRGVRSSVVQAIRNLLLGNSSSELGESDNNDASMAESLVRLHSRSTDVSNCWPAKERDSKRDVSRLRDAVTEALSILSNDGDGSGNLTVSVGLTDVAQDTGRTESLSDHLVKYFNSKIVVVSQRDDAEDESSLMDALVSGALVFTDPMLTMPSGIEDGKSLVVYRSLDDMVAKVRFYLNNEQERKKIALLGFKVAISQHRSWHGLEKIVLEDLNGV